MTIRKRILIIVAIAIPIHYWVFALYWPPIRYRLTLIIDDNGRPVFGSGVIKVHFADAGPLPENVMTMRPTGEAVAVDLGQKGVLFALLTGDPTRRRSPSEPGYLITHSYAEFKHHGVTRRSIEQTLGHRQPVEIPLDRLPMLVRFRDINDPKTVERVDPNDLAASFGPGVRLTRATIEITDDRVTKEIEKLLGWWFAQAKPPFDPPVLRYPDNSPRGYDTLSVTMFVQGLDWRPQ